MVRRVFASLVLVLALAAPALAGNPCFSRPDPVYTTGYETLVVSTAAVGLTIPSNSLMAVVVVETDSIRYRDDGTAPTSTVGMPVASGGGFTVCGPQLSPIRFIRSGSNDASLKVSYYGR